MSDEPLIKSVKFEAAVIDEMLIEKAVHNFNINNVDAEQKPVKSTIIEKTLEHRPGGDKIVHILYREGKDEYAD